MENGEKETFFGSDRMELLAFVIGTFMVTCLCINWNNGCVHVSTGEKWEGPLTELKAQL